MSCKYPFRVYKNEDITLSFPVDFDSEPNEFYLHVYTVGDAYVDVPYSALTIEDGVATVVLDAGTLDPLNDGVIRFEMAYSEGDDDYTTDANTNMVLKTPSNYSGKTADEMWMDGYQSGLTDCSGVVCDGVYESGVTAGISQQKAKLADTAITQNATYTRTDGWKRVVVNVPQTGHTDAEMQEEYERGFDDGLSACSGDCEGIYESGITEGIRQQKSLLTNTGITSNGTYTRENGWNEVIVNVPQTGYTQQDLDNAFNRGYNSGYTDGYMDGQHDYSGSTDFIDQYLTFEVLSAGTLSWYSNDGNIPIERSVNGQAWQNFNTSLQLNVGDKVRFRGNNSCYYISSTQATATWNCYNGLIFNVYGNIMSLIAGSNFRTATTLTDTYVFRKLFYNLPIESAENLVLPATTLSQGCYMEMFEAGYLKRAPKELPATVLSQSCYNKMFESCHFMTTSPILPAPALNQQSYSHMYYNCVALNSIKCLATDITAEDCTNDWVYQVSSTGTFTKSSSMSNWTSGQGGIPVGWTVVDAS